MSPALALGQGSPHIPHVELSHAKDCEAVVLEDDPKLTFVVGPGDAETVGWGPL